MSRRAILAIVGLLAIAGALALVLVFCQAPPAPAPLPVDPPPIHTPEPRDPLVLVEPPDDRAPVEAPPDDATPSTSATPTSDATWHAYGTVRARTGKPIAEARVELSWTDATGRERAVGTTTCGAQGEFEVGLPDLDSLGPAGFSGASILARAFAPGHQPKDKQGVLQHALTTRRIQINLMLDAGSALSFTAVDARGTPLPQAEARFGPVDESNASKPIEPMLVRADAGGRFAIGFASATRYELFVRAENSGVALRTLDITSTEDMDLGQVVLEGGPPIEGVARHPDGTPAPGLELWALEGNLAYGPQGLEDAERAALKRERAGGLSLARCSTDASGRFSLGGLRPGHYAIRARETDAAIEPRQGRWEPGAKDVAIEVVTPRLVVRVVDAGGSPTPGAIVEAAEVALNAPRGAAPGRVRRVVASGPQAVASFAADPETPLAVRARSGQLRSGEDLAFLGQGVQHVEVVLQLAKSAEPGSIRLALSGVEPRGPVKWHVQLLAPRSRAVDSDVGELQPDENGVVRRVPPGEYALSIGFSGTGGAWLHPWKSRDTIRVEPGAETLVLVDAELGARLAVRTELVGPPPPGFETVDRESASARDRFGALFVLVGADGTRRSLDVTSDAPAPIGIGYSGDRLWSGTQLLPGEHGVVDGLLPVGDWTLVVDGAAWMPAEHRIRLLAGQQLEAYAELRARR